MAIFQHVFLPNIYLLGSPLKKTNSREACFFQRKRNKYLHDAILKGERAKHIVVVTSLHWIFSSSQMKCSTKGMITNPNKYQAMILGNTNHSFNFRVNNINIPGKDDIDLLGVNIDKNLQFTSHFKKLINNS